jgi:hypothetical protein
MSGPSVVDAATQTEFYARAGHIPDSAAEWAEQQAVFRRWRTEARFEPYWALLDGLLAKDFAATRPWAAAAHAARELRETGYDFDACREQRDYDVKHGPDQRP